MNQEKIGKFIQEMRKQKGLTQEELAEKLNVSNKTISRWENGINLPDASLYNLLCQELNISINELLSGQKLEPGEYQQKLEENVLLLNDKTNKKIKKVSKKITIIIIFIVLVIILLIISGIIYFKIKDYKDNKKIYYPFGTVHFEICEYKPNTRENQIIIKSKLDSELKSIVESKINENGDVVIRNYRYEKWDKNPDLAISQTKVTPIGIINRIYYDNKLIYDGKDGKNPIKRECIESRGLTRTFDIEAKEKSGSLDGIYVVTIKKCDTKEKYMVFVKEEFANNLEIGKTYEFTFKYSMTTFLKDKTGVRDIFEQLDLLSVNETNRICPEQINDEIY